MEGAFDWLRKRGAAKASDYAAAGRAASEGLVAIVDNGFDAAIVAVRSETDFVARNEDFQEFVTSVAQAAAAVPPPPSSGVHPVSMDALLEQPLPGHASEASISEALAEVVGRIRESISVQKASRVTSYPGVVGTYVHGSVSTGGLLGKSGCVVALGTGEAAPTDEQAALLVPMAKRLAMHVTAARPKYLDVDSVPAEAVAAERALLMEQAASTGKPENILEKMVDGRMKKFYAETTLMHQSHLVEPDGPEVAKWLQSAGKEVGLPLSIEGFVLYSAGDDE